MNGRYTRVPREIAIVQCEDVGHSVNQHGSYEPSIVHFLTRYRMLDDEATPFRIDAFSIRQLAATGLR